MEFRRLGEENHDMRNNFRRVKPLNGRTVYRTYEELGLFQILSLSHYRINFVQISFSIELLSLRYVYLRQRDYIFALVGFSVTD